MNSEVNSFAVNSNEIIAECLKEYGKGELFLRADGLELRMAQNLECGGCDAALDSLGF